jgi:hypothetical protein
MAGALSSWAIRAGGLCALLLVACGNTPRLPEAASTPPLVTNSVSVTQTGTAPVTIVPDSAQYRLDDSGSLVVTLRVTSEATAPQTITARASLYDTNGKLVGDATGGDVGVDPGQTVTLQLDGPPPMGEIVSASYEFTALPIPGST